MRSAGCRHARARAHGARARRLAWPPPSCLRNLRRRGTCAATCADGATGGARSRRRPSPHCSAVPGRGRALRASCAASPAVGRRRRSCTCERLSKPAGLLRCMHRRRVWTRPSPALQAGTTWALHRSRTDLTFMTRDADHDGSAHCPGGTWRTTQSPMAAQTFAVSFICPSAMNCHAKNMKPLTRGWLSALQTSIHVQISS